jgi:hypothetical protein
MRGQMRDFQQKMQGQQGSQESFQQNATSQKEKSSVKEGDYIDFEEIK